jgi:tetratricopeptide (TPR) repeat protein
LYHQQSLAIAQGIKDQTRKGNILGYLGHDYFELGDYFQAMECYQTSLELAKSTQNLQGICLGPFVTS